MNSSLLAFSPLSLCKYFVRNLFLAGPLLVGVSSGEEVDEEDAAVRFRGAAAAAASEVGVTLGLSSLGGSAGSTTATAPEGGFGGGVAPRGHERSSGCIWQSAFILAAAASVI